MNIIIRDLSRHGAAVQAHELPPVGTPVLLRRGKSDLLARIVWRDGDKGGAEFQDCLTRAEFDRLIRP